MRHGAERKRVWLVQVRDHANVNAEPLETASRGKIVNIDLGHGFIGEGHIPPQRLKSCG